MAPRLNRPLICERAAAYPLFIIRSSIAVATLVTIALVGRAISKLPPIRWGGMMNRDWSVPLSLPGMYDIAYDRDVGIVRILGLQSNRPEDLDSYLALLIDVYRRCRSDHKILRAVVDLRGAPVRTQAIAERLQRSGKELYRTGDRVALVVGSSLFKMQLRRIIVPEIQEIFLDTDEAEAWLLR